MNKVYMSHSAKDKFNQCSYKWKLHYQDKLRPTQTGSPLPFGSAMDSAWNTLLLKKKRNLTKEEKDLIKLDFKDVFLNQFNSSIVNTTTFSHSNYQLHILQDNDIDDITDYKYSLNDNELKNADVGNKNGIDNFMSLCKDSKSMNIPLSKNEQLLYNFICYQSLLRLGIMILEEYESSVMPLIEEVYSVQEKGYLNDEGDTFVVVIDAIVSFYSEPGVKYIIDNKTSAKPYTKDSVQESEQLASYAEYKQIYKCAYIVAEKKARKKAPQIRINIIKDEIKQDLIDKTFDNITNVVYNIKQDNFVKNLDNCWSYGQKCEYYDYCRSSDMKGLYKKDSNE